MGKVDFEYLSEEFDSDVIDLVKRKGFYPYEYMSDSKNFLKIATQIKVWQFINRYKVNSDEEYDHAVKNWDRFEITTKKDYHDLF